MAATMATMIVVAVACPAPVVKSYFRGQRLNAGQLGVSVAARRSVLVVRSQDDQLFGAGKGEWENLDKYKIVDDSSGKDSQNVPDGDDDSPEPDNDPSDDSDSGYFPVHPPVNAEVIPGKPPPFIPLQ